MQKFTIYIIKISGVAPLSSAEAPVSKSVPVTEKNGSESAGERKR